MIKITQEAVRSAGSFYIYKCEPYWVNIKNVKHIKTIDITVKEFRGDKEVFAIYFEDIEDYKYFPVLVFESKEEQLKQLNKLGEPFNKDYQKKVNNWYNKIFKSWS